MPMHKSASKGADNFPSLRKLVKDRLLKDVFEAAEEKSHGWKILVVDPGSMAVISSSVGMYDIMERRITIVESLEKKRAPFPDKGVIYLMEPTEDSISKLIEDYANKKPLYGPNVFLFFLQRLPDPLLEKIKYCRPLVKRVKALSEVNIDFLAKEDRGFTFDMRESFAPLYSRQGANKFEEVIANKLVTVCATLNEYPHIRYSKSSKVCDTLATLFHKKMDAFLAANPSWWYHGGSSKNDARASQRDRAVLLLLDRADDCLTPLMHDFHYQSMVHDLLKVERDRITTQAETQEDATETEAKDFLLDEKDELWVEIRGKHIAQVIELLSARIREIMNSNTGGALGGKKGDGEKKMSLTDMAAALKALPEYREIMSKLSQHMHISHECMDVFSAESLMDLSEIEQTLATGMDDEGRQPKMSEIIDRVELCLRKMKDPKARIRLILIATLSANGLNYDDRNRLLGAADFSRSDGQTVDNLKAMGAKMGGQKKEDKAGGGGGGFFSSLVGADSGDDDEDEDGEIAQSRFKPVLKRILQGLLGVGDQPLSFEDFPSVVPMPEASSGTAASSARGRKKKHHGGVEGSARKGGGKKDWNKAHGGATSGKKPALTFTGARSVVFTVGGMAHSEMRICREMQELENREIIFGSTAFVTAKDFVEDLSTLS
ncbi:Syntaxin-binding protein 1 [Seminavis robusta]|uniref:Syntaxin-binding protein 1 n=1 Tax=Seminavis robusta TaxID=568900 RepID=A0A9N8DH54_9STRA|nr:Syntaxin-binding protein 1 [Seminavis robusta]|eukprot:Sro88_g046590.1 Syntaxin-binding protein 1 (661) ;mRNA; r:75210-77498